MQDTWPVNTISDTTFWLSLLELNTLSDLNYWVMLPVARVSINIYRNLRARFIVHFLHWIR
jgi:hypothetical protein